MPDGHNEWPLHKAAETGQVDVIETLLANAADVNARDPVGRTPLFLATEENQFAAMKLLIRAGAKANYKDSLGRSPLHVVAQGGRAEAIPMLLEILADVNASDSQGRTPLHLAAQRHPADPKVLTALLNAGAKLNARDKDNFIPLERAVEWDRLEAVASLLEHGSLKKQTPELVHSLLYRVAGGGNVRIAELLLDHRAEVNWRDGELDETPLHVAASQGFPDMVGLLLDHGAKPNVKNLRGASPLHRAVGSYQASRTNEFLAVIKLLLDNGADVNLRDEYQWTPLHWLALDEDGWAIDLLEPLLKAGADRNAAGHNGQTALQIAEQRGRKDLVDLLGR